MRIKELHIQNFRGFEDITIQFPESNVCVFIGANGSGKSSILEAICIYLPKIANIVTRNLIFNDIKLDNDDIKINEKYFRNTLKLVINNQIKELEILKDEENVKWVDSTYHFSSKDSKDKNLPILLFYRTNRNVLSEYKQGFEIELVKYRSDENYGYKDAFSTKTTNFNSFLEWFRLEEDKENEKKIRERNLDFVEPQLEKVRKSVETFFSELGSEKFSEIRIERESNDLWNGFKGNFGSSLSILKNTQRFNLGQISDGERILMMMICDIARRLTILNPKLNLNDCDGIILIDEIELHLHPQWQRNVIPALRKTFPNIQFIITTHSPQVLSNIENNEVILLENGKAFQNFAHNFGQDSNTILTDFFNTSERPDEIKLELEKLFQLIELEKNKEAKSLLESLMKKLGENDYDLIKAKTELEYFADEIH